MINATKPIVLVLRLGFISGGIRRLPKPSED